MEEKKLDPEVRLNILGLKKEELVGLTINEQIKVLKKAYRQKAKNTHPDVTDKNGQEFKKVSKAYQDLLELIKKGYFVEKKEEKSDVDSPFINMVNDNNRQTELDELEDLLDEYAEYEEKRKHNKNVSKMVRKFNNPWFRIKDAIQYCRDKVKKIINTRSRFHNDKGQDR